MIYTSRCTKGCRLRLFLRADVKWHLSVVTFLLLFPPMLWTFIAWTLSSLFLEQGKGRGELGNPHQIERMLSISIDRFDRVDAIVKGTGIGILWRFECNVCDYTQLFCDGGAWDSGLDSFRLVMRDRTGVLWNIWVKNMRYAWEYSLVSKCYEIYRVIHQVSTELWLTLQYELCFTIGTRY